MHGRRLLTALATLLLFACGGVVPTAAPATPPTAAPATAAPTATLPVAASPSPSAVPPLASASPVGAIRTKPQPAPPNEICDGVGLDAILHGEASDPRIAWLVNRLGGKPFSIVWPFGYSARFAPALEVLDAGGAVVAREGDHITGVCSVLADGSVYLTPPFR